MLLKSTIVLGGLALVVSLMASPRLAAADAPVVRPARSTDVYVGDLNLNTRGDVATLYKRIRAAAEQVCGSRAFTGWFYTYTEYRGCVADATQRAVREVNRTELTRFYQQHGRHSGPVRVAQQ
jgi:UrcA family protein